jgi:uncharacterized protein
VVRRFDKGTLKPPRVRADGSIRFDGYLTRSGVFLYRRDDGSIKREWRSPDEVFKADSLVTLELATVTNDHPVDFVTPANAKKLAVGSVGDTIVVEDSKVRASIAIVDADTIKAITDGKREISCGYECTIIDESGVTPDGEHYDTRQVGIVYNHVAIVDRGRAGPQVRLNFDAAEQVDSDFSQTKTGDDMDLKEALLKIAQLEAQATLAKQASDKLEGERDALTAKLADESKQRADAIVALPKVVKDRVTLLTKASVILKSNADALSALTDRQIKCSVIKGLSKVEISDEKSEAYVDGCYDSALSLAAASAAVVSALSGETEKPKDEEVVDFMTAERNQMKMQAAEQRARFDASRKTGV